MVINKSVNNMIQYVANLSSWSGKQLQSFEATMMKLYRKIYRLMPTTADSLLALPMGSVGEDVS